MKENTSPSEIPARVLVVSFGSIAKRHIQNLKRLRPDISICVWRQFSQNSELGELSNQIDQVCYSLEEALKFNPQAALITNPSSKHLSTALALAKNQIHLLIEKPLSNATDGIQSLEEIVQANNLVVEVAYNFKFYKPLLLLRDALNSGKIGKPLSFRAEVGQYLPTWRGASDYRTSASASEKLGGGALLELSHEIDYARWLMGEIKEVHAISEKLSNLEINVEDTVEIICRFESGAIGSIHLDMINQKRTRSCQVIGNLGTLSWDAIGHTIHYAQTETSDYVWNAPINPNDMYLEELIHFFERIRGKKTVSTDLTDAKKTLEVIGAIRKSAKEKRGILI